MWRTGLKWLRFGIVPVVLVVGAIVIGGVAGILLAFLAGLLMTDRILERVLGGTGWDWLDAERRYARVARQRRRAGLARRLQQGPSRAALEYLPDDTGWAAVAARQRMGVAPIGLDSIVGTSDRHKAEAFDGAFRPPEWSRGRWTLLYLASLRGVALPPIAVYRVGDKHFVRDGHHRVSVARARGEGSIDAEIVELRAPEDR